MFITVKTWVINRWSKDTSNLQHIPYTPDGIEVLTGACWGLELTCPQKVPVLECWNHESWDLVGVPWWLEGTPLGGTKVPLVPLLLASLETVVIRICCQLHFHCPSSSDRFLLAHLLPEMIATVSLLEATPVSLPVLNLEMPWTCAKYTALFVSFACVRYFIKQYSKLWTHVHIRETWLSTSEEKMNAQFRREGCISAVSVSGAWHCVTDAMKEKDGGHPGAPPCVHPLVNAKQDWTRM